MIKLKEILLLEKTLYHGTTVDNVSSIKKYGLIPDRGDFTSDMYGGSYEDEDHMNSDIPKLTFAADKSTLDNAITAATHHIAKKLDKGFHDVTDEDFLNHGAIVKIFDESDFKHRPSDDENYYGSHPSSVEPGDYYSEDSIHPDEIVTGPAMIRLLKRYGKWPRTYGDDTNKGLNQKRDFLIKYYLKRRDRKKYTKYDVIKKIMDLSDKDLNFWFNKHKNNYGKINEIIDGIQRKAWWLNPSGKLFIANQGHHDWARKYLSDNNIEYNSIETPPVEFLKQKGWVQIRLNYEMIYFEYYIKPSQTLLKIIKNLAFVNHVEKVIDDEYQEELVLENIK